MSASLMIALLFLMVKGEPVTPVLEGCLDPAALAEKVKDVRSGWDRLTPEQLVHKWDVQLAAEQCETDGGQCQMFVAQRRVIRGTIDCSEAFVFVARAKEPSPALTDVVIKYAAKSQPDVARAARLIVEAIHPPDKSGPSGTTLEASPSVLERAAYQWDEGRFTWVVTVDAVRDDPLWRLHVNITRHDR